MGKDCTTQPICAVDCSIHSRATAFAGACDWFNANIACQIAEQSAVTKPLKECKRSPGRHLSRHEASVRYRVAARSRICSSSETGSSRARLQCFSDSHRHFQFMHAAGSPARNLKLVCVFPSSYRDGTRPDNSFGAPGYVGARAVTTAPDISTTPAGQTTRRLCLSPVSRDRSRKLRNIRRSR